MAVSIVTSGGGAISDGSPSVTFAGYVPQLNDFILMFPSSQSTLALNASPSGWVNPLGSGVEINGDSHGSSVGYHWVTSGEVSGGTTTYTMTSWFGTETGYVHGVVLRGVDLTTPIDSINTTFDDGNTVTPHLTATLTGANLGNNSMVIACVTRDSTGAYGTTPTGWTDIQKTNTNQAKWTGRRDALTTAGADVTAASISPSAGDEYISITVAITPAAEFAATQAEAAFYEDGTESGSTVIDSGADSITRDVSGGDSNLLLRLRLQETGGGIGGVSTDDYQLQYELNDGGTYVDAGTTATIGSYASANQNTFTAVSSGNADNCGQSFTATGDTLGSAQFYLMKTGTPTGNGVAKLYAHSGVFGTSSVGTGAALATSSNLDVSTLTGSYALQTFDFSGYRLSAGTNYVIVFEYTGGDAGNYVRVGADNSAPTHAGNMARFESGGWIASSGADVVFSAFAMSYVNNFNSGSLTDGNATTNRLGSGSGSFVAGEISEDGLVDNLEITASNYTELLYSLTIDSDAVEDEDTIDFRVLRNGATTGMTYTVTPRITIEESAGGDPSVSKSDSVTVTESVQRLVESYVNKSDTATITESVKVELTSHISKSDSITITESVQRMAENRVAVSDSPTVTENVTVLIPELLVNKSESITVTESVQRLLESYVSKSDTVTVTESIARLLTSRVDVSDTATVTENVVRLLESYVSKSDATTLTEAITVLITELHVNKSDSVTVSESVSVSIIDDNPGDLAVTVSDTVTVTESVARLPESYINRSDTVTVSEAVQLLLQSHISVSETATVTENIVREVVGRIVVSDTATVSEALDLEQESFIAASDTVTVTENADPELVSFVNVSDTATITESLTTLLPTLFINESETITVTENRIVSVEGVVNPRRYYIDTNGNIYFVINQNIGLVEKI